MEKLIYVVDDEENIRELVSLNLKKYGFKTKEFADGKALLNALNKSLPDLIILDIMMPGIDGFEVIKKLKAEKIFSVIPVILLTAKTEETDKIVGLEIGADDYVTKPFSPKELVARVKATLRRYTKNKEDKVEQILRSGPIYINTDTMEVTVNNERITLTATEYRLLQILISNKNRVCSRDFLLDKLWGDEKIVIDRTIDVHIKHLRDKLGKVGKMIKNLRGFGYKIKDEK